MPFRIKSIHVKAEGLHSPGQVEVVFCVFGRKGKQAARWQPVACEFLVRSNGELVILYTLAAAALAAGEHADRSRAFRDRDALGDAAQRVTKFRPDKNAMGKLFHAIRKKFKAAVRKSLKQHGIKVAGLAEELKLVAVSRFIVNDRSEGWALGSKEPPLGPDDGFTVTIDVPSPPRPPAPLAAPPRVPGQPPNTAAS